jgi:hypothetical protein
MVEKKIETDEMMVEMFKRCNFMLYSANKNSFEEGLRFTENNIVAYLSELEEYICALILFTANKLNLPNHATAFLSLEKLELRTHERREGPVSLNLLTLWVDHGATNGRGAG